MCERNGIHEQNYRWCHENGTIGDHRHRISRNNGIQRLMIYEWSINNIRQARTNANAFINKHRNRARAHVHAIVCLYTKTTENRLHAQAIRTSAVTNRLMLWKLRLWKNIKISKKRFCIDFFLLFSVFTYKNAKDLHEKRCAHGHIQRLNGPTMPKCISNGHFRRTMNIATRTLNCTGWFSELAWTRTKFYFLQIKIASTAVSIVLNNCWKMLELNEIQPTKQNSITLKLCIIFQFKFCFILMQLRLHCC